MSPGRFVSLHAESGGAPMTATAILIGMVIGGVWAGFPGVLAGAMLGYGAGIIQSLRTRLSALEHETNELRIKLERSEAETPAAATVCETPPPLQPPQPVHETADTIVMSFDEQGVGETGSPGECPSTLAGASLPPPGTVPAGEPDIQSSISPSHPLLDAVSRFFPGGSLLVKTGIIVLFFGISFLVKYAAEHALLPTELRLTAAALAGVCLLAVGWRLRLRRANYAHALQGGGVGVLYLTTFAAFRLYALLPPTMAFAIFVVIAAVSATLAILQDSRSLAVLGASGGFLAPVLASTGSGSHIALFSYYTLLNLGIAGIAWFRAWRVLNLLGFAFTFIIGASWGWRYYQPEFYSSTEPFLILFFLLYTFIAVLFALRQPPDLKGYLDGTLVFGTPIVAFSLQAMLVRPYPFGLAWSAFALGIFYLPLAWFMFSKKPVFMRMLTEAFLAFGVIFGTLAIPLALESRWTSAAWALEGAAILWAGLRQKRKLARAFGILLQVGAGMAFFADMHSSAGLTPVLNGDFLGCVLIALTGLFSARCIVRYHDRITSIDPILGHLLLAWGLIWWFSGGIHEINRFAGKSYEIGILLVFIAMSCSACSLFARRLNWPALSWPALCLLPALFITALVMVADEIHPLAQGGLVGWPLAFACCYHILYRHDTMPRQILHPLHAAALWLAAGLVTLELTWRMDHWIAGSPVWPLAAIGFVPALTVLLVATQGMRIPWPFGQYRRVYLTAGAGPLAIFAVLWIWWANFSSPANPSPLRYLPILNPLDLTVGFTAAALTAWITRLRTVMPEILAGIQLRKLSVAVISATLFIWLNGILIRTVHHWGGVGFSFASLFHSLLLQALLSIFWSILSLCIMLYATRKSLRTAWLAGAGLLGAVLVKLFLIDLSGTGTVSRIVSFVGVGFLLLVIGYFAPVPPRNSQETGQ